MNEPTAQLLQTPPAFLSRFVSFLTDIRLPEKCQSGHTQLTRAIECPCGSTGFYLEAAMRKELKGVCRKQENISFMPPIYTVCAACKQFTRLFDPAMHGRNAEINPPDDHDDNYRLMRCTLEPGKVYVAYAYHDMQGINELSARGIKNPEDYFDSIVVLFADSDGQNVEEVLSFRCA